MLGVTLPELAELRDAIDAVDRKILQLVAERVRLVLAVGDIKRQRSIAVYDPERERSLLARLSENAPAPLDATTVRRIFERLIDESRRLEQHHVQGDGSGTPPRAGPSSPAR
jgi:chorismate mutase-like protein